MRYTNPYAILLLAYASLAAPANATDLDTVSAWLTSSKPWMTCPPASPATNPNHPGFAFNKAALSTVAPIGACQQSGPHVWHPTANKAAMWWVQVITNLRPNGCADSSCLRDVIRICSPERVLQPGPAPPPPATPGPCGSTNGVGPGGCEVCAVPAP